MSNEHVTKPAPKRPHEVFGLNEQERLYWRVNQKRLDEILDDDQTIVHKIQESSNTFGELLFVTTSRPGDQGRVAMTFYGLVYHEHRERWLTNEWFWYQANVYPEMMREQIDKEEAKEMIQQRLESIFPYSQAQQAIKEMYGSAVVLNQEGITYYSDILKANRNLS